MVAPSLFVVEPVAQQHTELIAFLLDIVGNVVDVEKHGLVVVAPQGGEHRLSYLMTIDGQLVETQSADAQLGVLDSLPGLEAASQNDAAS